MIIMQAYSPMPPHGFMASSPQAHPYMWGVQVCKFHYGVALIHVMFEFPLKIRSISLI